MSSARLGQIPETGVQQHISGAASSRGPPYRHGPALSPETGHFALNH